MSLIFSEYILYSVKKLWRRINKQENENPIKVYFSKK